MIDRIRLTASAKVQLSTLKRKTGMEHYNSICRHALCLSLAESSMLPDEDFNYSGGLEIDWRVFTGGFEELYLNLLLNRLKADGAVVSSENVKSICAGHLHRGLSYLAGKGDDYLVRQLSMLSDE
jgi:DNA sulfur modification protein DndE